MKITAIGTALITLALLFSYQNCSVHESEGRKTLNTLTIQDLIDERTSSSSSLGKLSGSHCEPFLRQEDFQKVFTTDFELKLYHNEEFSQWTCLASSHKNSENGLETVLCSISAEELGRLQAPQSHPLADPHAEGMLSGGSLGFVSQTTNNTTLHFLGALADSNYGIRCSYTFTSQASYQAQAQAALERASHLVHSIAKLAPKDL